MLIFSLDITNPTSSTCLVWYVIMYAYMRIYLDKKLCIWCLPYAPREGISVSGVLKFGQKIIHVWSITFT